MGGKSKSATTATQAGSRISLPADFRIAEVAGVHQQMLSALQQGPVTLDGAAVEKVDAAALQLLLAFERAAQAQNVQSHWTAASRPLIEAAELAGLAKTLALPAAMPA